MLATMDKDHTNSEANNIYREHLQTITLMNRRKEMVPLSSGTQATEPVNIVEVMLLSSAALFAPVTWFLEYLARHKGSEKELERRSFHGSICNPKARGFQLCGAHQPSPTTGLTDILVDSLKEEVEVKRKRTSSGNISQLVSESVLSTPKTTAVTSLCSVFNWRNKTVLTRGNPSIREVLQKRLQDILHDTSVYVKMRLASQSQQPVSNADSQTLGISSTSLAATWSQRSKFWSEPVESAEHQDGRSSLASGSQISNFGEKPVESAEKLDCKSSLATGSQASPVEKKCETEEDHDLDYEIKCALCKGRKFIRESSEKTLSSKTSDLICSVAKQSVDMVIRAVKAGEIVNEVPKRIKVSLADKILKVLGSAGITPDDSQSSTTSMLRKNPEQNRTQRSKSDSNLFNLFRIPKKLPNIPGRNSDIAAAVHGSKATFTSSDSSSSSITLASNLTSTISSYIHQAMNNLLGVLSKEIQRKSEEGNHTQVTSNNSGITSSCSEATSPVSRTELPMNKEDLNSAASSSLNAAIEENTIAVNSAVLDAVKNFAGATADQVLDAIHKAMTKPMIGSYVIPDTEGQQNLVQQVFLLIQDHHDLIASIHDELLMQAYAKQYSNTIVANAIMKARYELKQGSWVFTQKDEIVKKLKRGAKEAIRRMFVETTKNKAKLKRILTNRNFQIKVINTVMSTALKNLEGHIEQKDRSDHSCCCNLINKVNLLAKKDKKALNNLEILDKISEDLLRNLAYEAAEHLGGDMASLLFDFADYDTVAHIAVKGTIIGGLRLESCLQSMAQVLMQIDEDLDVSM